MTLALKVYVACWLLACAVALGVALRRRRQMALFERAYWRHLGQRWKLVIFGVAWVGIVVIAPYSGDPTWDWFDASFMAILAYTTAPYSLGVLARAARGRAPAAEVLVVVVLWLFSASWSYDGYLLLKNGRYPETWAWNLVASSCLYFLAGLLWSLAWAPERGVHFAFLADPWPPERLWSPPPRLFGLVALIALPVAAAFLWFVFEYLGVL